MTSSVFQLPFSYLFWHYTTAWGDLLRLYRNFSWFLWNFFSVKILTSTLFAPWRRLHEGASKETAGFLGSLIVNLILRCIGFVARTFTILIGLSALVLLFAAFLVFLALWIFLPMLIFLLIANGIIGLVSF